MGQIADSLNSPAVSLEFLGHTHDSIIGLHIIGYISNIQLFNF